MKMTARSIVFELDEKLGGLCLLAVTSVLMELCADGHFLFCLVNSNLQ